ncbi:hypothetical protein DUNSADRAFT_11273 [Dunaliella salina]|uniref:Encoded protein n=1 Tax=Dunaliella salina TaxID=3046 RepID=A0ABZ3K856_DUNSA|nr:hypothetical protein DUNSADRAFT_11273 [Dunaliella salina]|eukprot:KAF5825354.1 hypothetical protein DUNSADRAFT_11273 [Dunaliella salina]
MSKGVLPPLLLRLQKSTNEIESCTICYSRSLTHGFQHGNTVHFCACESCANMELKASVQRQQQKLQQQGAEQIPSEPLGLQSKQPVGQVVKPLCPQCKQPVDQLVKIIKDFIENGEGGSADPSSTQVPETRASPGQGVQVRTTMPL